MRRKLKLGKPSEVVAWSWKWSGPVQLSGPWQWQPVPDWLVTPVQLLPAGSCRVVSSSSPWGAALSPPVSLPAHFGSGLEILASFATLSATPAWAVALVIIALSALSGHSGDACSLPETWGVTRWLAEISSAAQAWQMCPLGLPSPVWPDSNDRLCNMVEMTTKQHSTSMQSLLQGNILQQCQARSPAIVGSNPLPHNCMRENRKNSFSTADSFSQQTAFEL